MRNWSRPIWIGTFLLAGMGVSVPLGPKTEAAPAPPEQRAQPENKAPSAAKAAPRSSPQARTPQRRTVAQRKPALRRPVEIHYIDQMKQTYRVVAARFRLCREEDVCTIFAFRRPYLAGPMRKRITVLRDKLIPGPYVLKVDVKISGYHPVFTYIKDYKATIKNELSFRVREGKPLVILAKIVDPGAWGSRSAAHRLKQIKLRFETIPKIKPPAARAQAKSATTARQKPKTRPTARPRPTARRKKANDINARFVKRTMKPKVWKKRFESPKREVFQHRKAIVAAMKIQPGQSVADVGAGSGAFLKPLVQAVGPKGTLYAVEISAGFVRFLKKRVKALGNQQVKVVHSTTTSTRLPTRSVDVIFVCDTYHHFDQADQMLADFRQILRPGGRLVIVDFKRIPGVSSKWLLNHVKVNEQQVTAQILRNGFTLQRKVKLPPLKENYMLIFQRKP